MRLVADQWIVVAATVSEVARQVQKNNPGEDFSRRWRFVAMVSWTSASSEAVVHGGVV